MSESLTSRAGLRQAPRAVSRKHAQKWETGNLAASIMTSSQTKNSPKCVKMTRHVNRIIHLSLCIAVEATEVKPKGESSL